MSKLRFSRKLLSIPYGIFLGLFVIIPLILIFIYAFTKEVETGVTPHFWYRNEGYRFTFDNVVSFFGNISNINTFIVSVLIGIANTIICILIGYPIAYILAKKEYNFSFIVVILFIMPMWINFVLRTSATREMFYGLKTLTGIDITGASHPYLATMIGMVYNYLPFVVLPLYTTMIKMNRSLIEASMDLGANPFQTFVKTIIPMTLPGVISAVNMVFMPTMSSFVISDVMGERQVSLIGNSIQIYFDQSMWHLGSFFALIMLVIIIVSMIATRNMEKEENARGSLW